MTLVPNVAKEKLARGALSVGFSLRQARTADIAPIAKACGFDWLKIDLEHNSMNLDEAAQISVAALGWGITPIVRVPGPEHWQATRLLDTGAQGIIVPHVETAEMARRVVEQCKFPPLGRRSLTGGLPQLSFAAANYPPSELVHILNDKIIIVLMLESGLAIENAEAIAAVEGVDVLYIGTNDLCADLGIAGQLGHDRIVEAYERVIAACRKYGRTPGMAGVYDHALMARYVKMGARFLQGGVDLAFMMQGAKARMDFLASIPLSAKD
ncbi:MAG: aldolase [Hyphomicrobiaceae bacterium]|nr:aldolase [Hyphomicrobiaceae bacterium]